MPKLLSTFLFGVFGAAAVVLAIAAVNRPRPHASLEAKPLVGDVWVSEQIQAGDFGVLKQKQFKSIIDLRPDGEAPNQPASFRVEWFAKSSGMTFAYVPVPHGDIPAQSVDALSTALASAQKPTLLYCRSGKRAARTWALVEASRNGGMDAAAIEAAVASVGQSADDLHQLISTRIAARAATAP